MDMITCRLPQVSKRPTGSGSPLAIDSGEETAQWLTKNGPPISAPVAPRAWASSTAPTPLATRTGIGSTRLLALSRISSDPRRRPLRLPSRRPAEALLDVAAVRRPHPESLPALQRRHHAQLELGVDRPGVGPSARR